MARARSEGTHIPAWLAQFRRVAAALANHEPLAPEDEAALLAAINASARSRDAISIERSLGLPPKWRSIKRQADISEVVELLIGCGYTFAGKEDDIGFNADGSSSYGGMRGITTLLLDGAHDAGKVVATAGHDTFAEIDTTDLTNLIGKLPAYALPGAKWFASQMAFATVFCRLASTVGGIIMQQTFSGRLVPTFLGFPIAIAQVLPQVTTDLSGSVMLLFGDLSLAATLGERRGVTVARSNSRFLDQDQIAWRGTERVDINVNDLGDASTAGPIVGLVGE